MLQERVVSFFKSPEDLRAQVIGSLSDYRVKQRQDDFTESELAALAPRVQNRVVKIRLQDVFIPLKARPEASRRRNLSPEMLRILKAEEVVLDERAELDDELSVLILQGLDRSALASRLAKLGYQVAGYEYGALSEGDTLDIAQLLDRGHVAMLGDPGSGKSTTLKYLAYAVAAQNAGLVGQAILDKIPILIEIADWQRAGGDLSLKAYLCRRIEDDPLRCALFEQAIDHGEALILLDALDEVPDAHSRGHAAEGVRRFVADRPGNVVLLTSRIVGYDGARLAGHFEHVTLEPLPKEEIARFCGNWYAAIEREAEGSEVAVQAAYERVEDLQAAIEGNPGVQGLAENRLLLTIIALVNWRGRRLPSRRVELYRHAAETLIESWPFVRRGIELDVRTVTTILEPVAHRIIAQRHRIELDEAVLQPLMIRTIDERLGDSAEKAEERATALLPQITEQSGIFVERGTDVQGRRYYGFLHRTFAEYFAARHLAERWRAGAVDLLPYARNPRWREVVLLMAGHLGQSDEQAATKLIAEFLDLPDAHSILKRNLLLAAQCLADDTPVQAQAGRYVMRQLATLACTGPAALRETAIVLLERLGATHQAQALIERLLDLSRDAEPEIRRFAADALGHVGDQAGPEVTGRAVERLLELSQDKNVDVQSSADYALGRVAGPSTPNAVRRAAEHLMALGEDANADVRIRAADTLGILCRTAPEDIARRVVERLSDISSDDNCNVRRSAIDSLGVLGNVGNHSTSKLAIEYLLRLSRDELGHIRLGATDALGRFGCTWSPADVKRAFERVFGLSWDTNSSVRFNAADALSRLGYRVSRAAAERAARRLYELARDEYALVRRNAASAIGRLMNQVSVAATEQAIDSLFDLTQDKDRNVRLAAADALGSVPGSVEKQVSLNVTERIIKQLLSVIQEEDIARTAGEL